MPSRCSSGPRCPPTADAGSVEYCRRARRLRSQFAGKPAMLHAALGRHARLQDEQRGWKEPSGEVEWGRPQARPVRSRYATGDPVLSSVLGVASASAERLARIVDESLCDGVLPYARRQEVLRAARRLGVGRFQANLLIAATQYRQGLPVVVPESRQTGKSSGSGVAVALILAFEAFCVAGAICVTHFIGR